MIVVGLGRLDLDTQRDGRQPMGLPAEPHGLLGVGQDLRRLQVPIGFVDHDLDGGVFQIDQLRQGGVQRQMGKATARSGNKHATTPFWVAMTPFDSRNRSLGGKGTEEVFGEISSPAADTVAENLLRPPLFPACERLLDSLTAYLVAPSSGNTRRNNCRLAAGRAVIPGGSLPFGARLTRIIRDVG